MKTMTNLTMPLAHWGIGTALIIIFAVVCVALTVIVVSFVMGGKKKEGDNINPSEEETF